MRHTALRALRVLVLALLTAPAYAQVWMLKDLAVPTRSSASEADILVTHPAANASAITEESLLAEDWRISFATGHKDSCRQTLYQGSVLRYQDYTRHRMGGKAQAVRYLEDGTGQSLAPALHLLHTPGSGLFLAVWGQRRSCPGCPERVLTFFWHYGDGRLHAAELIASEDEERYGAGAVELSQTRIVMRNDAFGICFETDQKKGKRFLTYWPDSGSFSFSKKAGEAGKAASALEVEAIAPLLR